MIVETCNGVGVDAFTAATIMHRRVQRYLEGQYQHVKGLSSTSPTEFLGMYGLTEGVLYALRMYEIVLQKGLPTDAERRSAMEQLIAIVDSIRGVLRKGYAADPVMLALPGWVNSLENIHM